jgi:hypothetical protein
MHTTAPTKICSTCKEELPISEFHRRRHYVKGGVRAACKTCTREATKNAREQGSRKQDPQKHRVRAKTREAIRRRKLTSLPCQICGAEEVEAHHLRYDGDDAHLDVDWLCKTHHALEHGKHDWTKQMDLFVAKRDALSP